MMCSLTYILDFLKSSYFEADTFDDSFLTYFVCWQDRHVTLKISLKLSIF